MGKDTSHSEAESNPKRKRRKKDTEKPGKQNSKATLGDAEDSSEPEIQGDDGKGKVSLLAAAASKSLKDCRLLISRSADVNQKSPSGLTPLHIGAHHGTSNICAALL